MAENTVNKNEETKEIKVMTRKEQVELAKKGSTSP